MVTLGQVGQAVMSGVISVGQAVAGGPRGRTGEIDIAIYVLRDMC